MNFKSVSPWLAGWIILSLLACSFSQKLPRIDEPPSSIPFLAPTSPPPTFTSIPTATPTPLPAVRIEKGDEALFNGDFESALQEYQTAFSTTSDPQFQAAALLGIGRTHFFSRNYTEAALIGEQILADFPDSPHLPETYFLLGQAYYQLNRYNEAAQAYSEYQKRRPGVIDAYLFDLAGDAYFAAGEYAAAATSYQAAVQQPSLLDQINIDMKKARSLGLSGDHTAALELYDTLYQRTTNENTRALIDWRKGEIYTSLGQLEQAHTVFLDAVQNYPATHEAYLALVALVEAGVPVDELLRGIIDYYAGEYGVAMAAFDRYLQNNPPDPATALYFYGLSNRELGGNIEAIDLWDKLIQNYQEHPYWDEAWEQKAYTQWAYLEQYPEARQTLLDFVNLAPGHPRAAEFLFDAAQVAERSEDLNQAAELWERVVNLYPSDPQANQALFLASITHFRRGDYFAALKGFQRLLTFPTTIQEKAAAHFWIGKTQAAMGDNDASRLSWETAAGIDPTGYYSERARDLINGRQPFSPPQEYDILFDIEAEKTQAENWIRNSFALSTDVSLTGLGDLGGNPHLIRGTELWKIGLLDDARAEFEQLRQSVQSDPASLYTLTNYLLELGLYRSAIMAARQVLNLASMDDAMTMSAPAYFNHVRFGTYYSDLVFPLSQQYGFHPLFLFSIIRQESLFEGFVHSSADARGLMQIMPATGAEIVQNIGWPANFSQEDLIRPYVNLTLGVEYLDAQRKQFNGNLYASLAAYNAGPGNAMQWFKLAPEDPDLFLEIIRYPETRDYIRRIFEIFSIYRFLYNRTP